MNIRFDEIPEEGLRLHIEEESWFPDREVERCEGVNASVFLQKKDQRIFVEGSIEATDGAGVDVVHLRGAEPVSWRMTAEANACPPAA